MAAPGILSEFSAKRLRHFVAGRRGSELILGTCQHEERTIHSGGLELHLRFQKLANEQARFRRPLLGNRNLQMFRQRSQEIIAKVLLVDLNRLPQDNEKSIFEPEEALQSRSGG